MTRCYSEKDGNLSRPGEDPLLCDLKISTNRRVILARRAVDSDNNNREAPLRDPHNILEGWEEQRCQLCASAVSLCQFFDRWNQDFLANTPKSVGKIAEILGFDSGFHLSKQFKNSSGLAPQAWRKR